MWGEISRISLSGGSPLQNIIFRQVDQYKDLQLAMVTTTSKQELKVNTDTNPVGY